MKTLKMVTGFVFLTVTAMIFAVSSAFAFENCGDPDEIAAWEAEVQAIEAQKAAEAYANDPDVNLLDEAFPAVAVMQEDC